MDHLDAPQFFAVLVAIFVSARLMGHLARWIGQPAVLGELLAGVLVGSSVLGLVNPKIETLHLLAELGVVILLFEIGLETDLRQLLRVGWASLSVAIAGVVLPFLLGYAVCRFLGLGNLVAIVAGASLTATSVGITARVFSELGRLQEPESQIVLGAAVIDDVLGLVILAVVAGMTQGQEVTLLGVAKTTGLAFGFLAAVLLVGFWLVPPLARWADRKNLASDAVAMPAIILALGLAWLAAAAGSAMIIGAFAGGLLLGKTPQAHEVRRGVAHLGHFFVPIFFVLVGAAVDVRVFNPLDAANHQTLMVGGLLLLAAVVGKLLAGYAPFWFRGNKMVIGVGMVPRGEVGLIFAQMGLSYGVFDAGLFGAVTLMVLVTTFMAPPLLKSLLTRLHPGQEPPEPEGIDELVTRP